MVTFGLESRCAACSIQTSMGRFRTLPHWIRTPELRSLVMVSDASEGRVRQATTMSCQQAQATVWMAQQSEVAFMSNAPLARVVEQVTLTAQALRSLQLRAERRRSAHAIQVRHIFCST